MSRTDEAEARRMRAEPMGKGQPKAMGNVLRVLKRDILRLLKTPAALVVVLALLVLPSLYTWYNVVGFWNPYDNTGKLAVDVVNQDEGASSDITGELHVGDMVVDQLKENHQLNWEFLDYDTAMADLESGACYAVFVIPPEFTADLLTLTTGSFTQPELEYYVNEKLGPVAPKITDTGATTLDETINAAFVSTVSRTAAEAIDEKLDSSRQTLATVKSDAAAKMGEAVSSVRAAKDGLSGLGAKAQNARTAVGEASGSLGGARQSITEASQSLGELSGIISTMQTELSAFSARALPAANEAVTSLTQAVDSAHQAAGAIDDAAGAVRGDVSAALAQARQTVEDNDQALQRLREIQSGLPADAPGADRLAEAITGLESANEQARELLDNLESINDQAGTTNTVLKETVDALDAASRQAITMIQGQSDNLFGTAVPAVQGDLGRLAQATMALSSAVAGQDSLIDQVEVVLKHLDATLETSQTALVETVDLLGGLEGELTDLQTDILSLSGSDAIQKLLGTDQLDAHKIAEFMGSPTELVTEQLYPLNAYGSAMAPLFMNLTFWIGAFMLLVILKQEVDAEGIPNLTLTQRYVGRFLLLAGMAVMQAVICCAGVLWIGVQTVSAPALFFAAAVASLSYLSIIYALSVTMQHVGKGICIVLVFAQIPGATGLYPIEMTPDYFQALYPLMPFTYGITAMREAICGFYGDQYAGALAMLGLFFVLFMAFGIGLRPLFSNVNRMVARMVRETGLINGENVEVPARRYRSSQIVRTMLNEKGYRMKVEQRMERFQRLYPKLIRGSIVAAVAVPVVCAVVFAFTPSETVVLITLWLVWFVVICVFLAVVENLRYGFERQMKLSAMSEAELRDLYNERNHMESAGAAGVSYGTGAASAAAGDDARGADCTGTGSRGEGGEGR